jgi:hypothetical protein
MKLGQPWAMAATPAGVYVATDRELVRFGPQEATTLIKYDGFVLKLEANAKGHVAAIADSTRGGMTLLLASDTDTKGKKATIEDRIGTQLASVDGAGRAWIMQHGNLIAYEPDGTQQIYPRGSFADMPRQDRGCEPIDDGFATLPKPGTFTGQLVLDIHGGGGLAYEVCDDPKAGSQESACAGAPERQAGTLDAGGSARLNVPTGHYEPAVRQAGEWLVPDYSSGSYNQTAGWCDVTTTAQCTIQVQVGS